MTARVSRAGSGSAQRLAERVEAAQAARGVAHRVLAVEMAANEHVQPGAGAAAWWLGQLQGDEAGGDDMVAPDDPRILDAEDLVEIDAAEGDEGRGGIRGRANSALKAGRKRPRR
jgi:hypothetical protein